MGDDVVSEGGGGEVGVFEGRGNGVLVFFGEEVRREDALCVDMV